MTHEETNRAWKKLHSTDCAHGLISFVLASYAAGVFVRRSVKEHQKWSLVIAKKWKTRMENCYNGKWRGRGALCQHLHGNNRLALGELYLSVQKLGEENLFKRQ